MANYVCNACGSTTFSYVNKDAAHIGLYCDGCGKWLKWAGKKEYTGKSLVPYTVFTKQIMQNKQLNGDNVTDGGIDVTNNVGGPQHTNNVYVQSQAVKVTGVGELQPANTPESKLQLKIAPRGEVTITTSSGEQVKLTNILIKVSSKGVVLLDVTGDIIKTYNFE